MLLQKISSLSMNGKRMDGLEEVEAENAEEAAKWAACTDGLESALFRVYEVSLDGEKVGKPEYFIF